MALQETTRGWRPATLALLGAAAIAMATVGYKIAHRGPVAPAAAASDPAGDGLAALQARVAADPHDGAAWLALGQRQFDENQYSEAVRAFEQAVLAQPQSAQAWSALGEARVMASARDPMPGPAAEAFARAIALDPKDARARYFLAVKRDLSGDHRGALDDWLALLGDTPPGAPWESDLRRTIEQVGKINKIDVATRLAAIDKLPGRQGTAARAIPGPTPHDLAEATAIPPSQQRGMAEGMVAQLEGKLRANPGNIDGWVMLMRSRQVLGQSDKASAALAAAIAANPAQADRLRQEASVLGVR